MAYDEPREREPGRVEDLAVEVPRAAQRGDCEAEDGEEEQPPAPEDAQRDRLAREQVDAPRRAASRPSTTRVDFSFTTLAVTM